MLIKTVPVTVHRCVLRATFPPSSDLTIRGDAKILISASVYQVEGADTPGAGDAFASGLICAHMNGMSLDQMTHFGAAMAAFECLFTIVRDGLPHDVSILKDFIAKNMLKVEVSTFKGM